MSKLPGKARYGGYIYLLEYEDVDRIKVGCTQNPSARIQTLRGEAEKYGLSVGRVWVSRRHENYRANESAMIKWLAETGQSAGGNEHFSGVNYEEAKSQARTLIFERVDEATGEEHSSTAARVLRQVVIDLWSSRRDNEDKLVLARDVPMVEAALKLYGEVLRAHENGEVASTHPADVDGGARLVTAADVFDLELYELQAVLEWAKILEPNTPHIVDQWVDRGWAATWGEGGTRETWFSREGMDKLNDFLASVRVIGALDLIVPLPKLNE